MQIFVKNNMRWFAQPLARQDIGAFLNHTQRGELLSVFAHANYLINLAATTPLFHANSIRALSEELTRADQLELPFLVLHPGAHRGDGEEAALEKIIASIDKVYRKIPKTKTKIALETTAGQGSCLGHRFEHLAHIMDNVRQPERLCVCLDTAHIFAAGYDISSESAVRKTFREFDLNDQFRPEPSQFLHVFSRNSFAEMAGFAAGKICKRTRLSFERMNQLP